jgi:cell wall-associated NlpC family hydrolase
LEAITMTPTTLITAITISLALVLGAAAGPTTLFAGSATACTTSSDSPVPRTEYDDEQVTNAAVIVRTGQQLRVPVRGLVIAVATALQESHLRNLPGGDRDSAGLFQQRTAWAPHADRTDPATAATMFYTGGKRGQPGLLDIPDWQSMPLTTAAQAVQRSAFPNAYARWEPDATTLTATTLTGNPTACTTDGGIDIPNDTAIALRNGYTVPPGTSTTAATAITWALGQLGTPYHYGGSCTDPHSGIPAKQCDCSSLVQQAYHHAGITLPRTTSQQIHTGTPVASPRDLRPGDLIFLPGHVGIYIGQNLVLHAPKTGDVVKVSKLQGYWLDQLQAIRRLV